MSDQSHGYSGEPVNPEDVARSAQEDQDRAEAAAQMAEELRLDFRTALLSGLGLGMSLSGILILPFLAPIGITLCLLGLRSCRPGYTTGRVMSYIGIGIGIVGVGLVVVTFFT